MARVAPAAGISLALAALLAFVPATAEAATVHSSSVRISERAVSIDNTANRPARLYRFSYDSGSKTWSRDTGFPVTIMTVSAETLVIDKDSTGTIWATWTQAKKVVVAHTTGSDLSWGVPFTPTLIGDTGLNR